jgi:hypothetical protein
MTATTRAVSLALGALLLAGCPSRIKGYAPRLHNTDFHREAVETKNCADCHDPAKIEHHSPQDDCTSCHSVCRGC